MVKGRTILIFLATALGFAMLWSGCRESKYDRLVKAELARNVRYDSLFLGLSFNMPRKAFFEHCWNLNKQHVVTNGPGPLSVQHFLDSSYLGYPSFMRFYPEFTEDKISKMPVEFTYEFWAPWNANLSADSLELRVKNLFERWYGGEFLLLESKKKGAKVWVKVDGNRRIRVYKMNISTVRADFVDLVNPANSKPND